MVFGTAGIEANPEGKFLMIDKRLSERLWRSVAGLAYFAVAAECLSAAVNQPFWATFAALLCGAVFTGGLAIWWLTLWAIRKDGRWGQFRLGSMIFLTVFAAIFLGAVRWLLILAPGPSQLNDGSTFLRLAGFILLLGFLSLPFVAFLNEALLWAAVWLVKRPLVQRKLARRRVKEKEDDYRPGSDGNSTPG